MALRPTGASSRPSSAWFSSSSWNARFSTSVAANASVTHSTLGARSIDETAVGSWEKLNTSSTRITNATAETIAVRERYSTSRSLRATTQAWRRSSRNGMAIILRDLARVATGARREMHEPSTAHEGNVGGELRAFFHVVRDQHRRATGRGVLRQQSTERLRGAAVESGERLVEQQHLRIVHEGPRDRRALHEAARQRAHRTIGVIGEAESSKQVVRYGDVVERRPERQVLAHRQLTVELRLVTDPADGAASAVDARAAALRRDQPGEHLEQCRFARAVRAEDRQCLAGIHAKGNIVEGPDGAEAMPESLSQQHRSPRRARSDRTV